MAVIPLIVSPDAVARYSLDPDPVVTADRPVTFSLPGGPTTGSLTPLNAVSTSLHLYNRSQDVVVHAVSQANPADAGDALVKVWGHVPHQPNFPLELDIDNKTLVSTAEDDSEVFSVKRGPLQTWRAAWLDNTFVEKEALKAFWLFHQKHRFWYYTDEGEGDYLGYVPLTYFVRFDSGLRIIEQGPDSFQITATITERPFTG